MFCERIFGPEKILNATPKWEFMNCFLLILLLYSNSNLGLVSGQCVQDQKVLLLELKSNLTYIPSVSSKLEQWNESIDCCRWGGVKCDFRGRVTALDLSSESIFGGIDDNSTSSLFKLEFLQSLNLAQNRFHSIQLSSGFGRLARLNYLNLSYSGFSGQIPTEFSNLTRLVVLDLSSTYSLLRRLVVPGLSSYKFQRGSDDRDLSSSSSSSSLNLENPDLKMLIRNFSRLRELYLDGVNISANAYQWCNAISSSLPDLRVLSLPYTGITGPFDLSLAKLQSLSVISLDGNSFSSPFPEFFADYPSLRALTLSSCNLSGVTPRKLLQITTLEMIDLRENSLLDGSLPEFPLNRSLQNLLLSHTTFSGNVNETIGNLKLLAHIDLGGCRFSGSIPKSFGSLTHLTRLDLSYNNLTGQIPNFLWEGLENLEYLDLSHNSLEGKIPASLIALPSLKSLYLRGNKFNGSVDSTHFLKLSKLVSLDLSYNNLLVHINENVSLSSLLPQLQDLSLASCKLRKFPLLKNHSLMQIDLSANNLTGEIPNWIWDDGNEFSYILNLSHNQFTSLQEPYNFGGGLEFLDLHSKYAWWANPSSTTICYTSGLLEQ